MWQGWQGDVLFATFINERGECDVGTTNWLPLILGIMLLAYGFFVIFKYKQLFKKEHELLDTKMEQLETMLQQSDQMIEELNNLSDYVVNRVEQANNELVEILSSLDTKVENATNTISDLESHTDETTNYSDENNDDASLLSVTNPKYLEVMKLVQLGYNEREIARELGLGQTEVKLLVGLKK